MTSHDDARRRGAATEFEAQLRERGRSYHIHHPFNVMLNTGRATPEQIRGWVANRFYYQIAIPVKDAAVLSNCPDREVRRGWVQRILDHDGFELGGVRDEGGIEAWLRLAQAVGLTRDEVLDQRHVIPGAALRGRCLRQLRAPRAVAGGGVLVAHRAVRARDPQAAPRQLARALPRGSSPTGLAYFRNRVSQARRDVEQGLAITLDHFTTRPQQERALEVLQFKLDILWAMNDAMALRYGVTAA